MTEAPRGTQQKNILIVVGVVIVVVVVGLAILAAVVLLAPPWSNAIMVSGRAIFDNGDAVEGARVFGSLGGDTSTTVSTVADANGNFNIELTSETLPMRVLVEVSFESDLIPMMQTSRWGDAESRVLNMGTIVIPSPEGAELTLANGAGQNEDNSIRVENLTADVDRLFGRSYDPDETPDAFPGEFAENGAIPLDSSMFVWMVGLDANGNPVEDLSQAATIRSRVPRSQWSDLEDINSGTDRIEVPIYTYNENTDVWEQEVELGWLEDNQGTVLPEDAQSMILDGTFSGEIFATFAVNHLSWMNVDYPYIGPWTLSRLDRDRRNVDVLYDALKLAQKIANSEKGRAAYAKVNAAGADLSIELSDGNGPELRTFSPADPQEYGVYKGDSGGSEDEFSINTRLWDFTTPGSSESQKKAATWMMALTILHETAHWKDDVKKFPDAGDRTAPDGPRDTRGEEGWQFERDLIGKDLFLNDDGTIREGSADGPQVSQDQIDQWLNPDSWPAAGGSSTGASGLSSSTFAREFLAQDSSPLQITISVSQSSFSAVDPIPVNVEYKNIGTEPISVFNLLILEDYPIRFDITHLDTGKTVGFLGPERKLGFFSTDFITLNPGENLTKTVDLRYDADGKLKRYNLRLGGQYQAKAVYSPFFGLPETESNTITFTLQGGGSVSGTVTSADNGEPLPGATVRAILDNNVVDAATTGADGSYTITALTPGSYTIEARAPGFLRTTRENVEVVAEQDTVVNFSISSLLARGELRLVLTWGQDPRDLDSHLWLPDDENTRYHIYYSDRGSVGAHPFASLDVDDTSSYGPETITITQRYLTGTYVYAVYHYAGSGSLATSQAQVQVFDSTGLIATFNVPSEGTGSWWNVLTIDGATGAITDVNEIGETPAPY